IIIVDGPDHDHNTPVVQPVVQPIITPQQPASQPQPQQAPIIITTPGQSNNAAPAPVSAANPATNVTVLGDSLGNAEPRTRRLSFDFLGLSRRVARVEVSCDGSVDCSGRVRLKALVGGHRVTLVS